MSHFVYKVFSLTFLHVVCKLMTGVKLSTGLAGHLGDVLFIAIRYKLSMGLAGRTPW